MRLVIFPITFTVELVPNYLLMKNFTRIALILVFFITNFSHSQEDLQLTSKDSIITSSSMFGLGFNFVDDSVEI